MYKLNDKGIFPDTPKQRWLNNRNVINLLKEHGAQVPERYHELLAAYCGAGTIAKVFDPSEPWQVSASEFLQQNLGRDEYNRMRASILWAYYTPPTLAEQMWRVITEMGFDSGNCLSVSAGTGMFTMTQPMESKSGSKWTLIEEDPTSADILRNLFPGATVIGNGFHKVNIPENRYDLFIDNVPFGNVKLHDPYMEGGHSIHDHALLKGLKALRPGGIAAIITSTHFLDSIKNANAREAVFNMARPIAVRRLHNETFKDFSNTQVTTDLIFLQKRKKPLPFISFTALEKHVKHAYYDGEKPAGIKPDLLKEIRKELVDTSLSPLNELRLREVATIPFTHDGVSVDLKVNKYILQYKGRQVRIGNSLMGGEFIKGGLYGRTSLAVSPPKNFDLAAGFDDIISCINKSFTSEVYYDEQGVRRPTNRTIADIYQPPSRKVKPMVALPEEFYSAIPGEFRLHNNILYEVGEGAIKQVKAHKGMIKDFLFLHEVTITLISAQTTVESDRKLKPLRCQLTEAFDKFENLHGSVLSKKVESVLIGDPRFSIVQALLNADGTRADIFMKRTVRPEARFTEIASIPDAFGAMLNAVGRVDLDYMHQLTNKPLEDIVRVLVQENLAYYDVDEEQWTDGPTYLSGNVVSKYESCNRAIVTPALVPILAQPHMQAQAIALKDVFPDPCLPHNVDLNQAIDCVTACGVDPGELSDDAINRMMDNTIEVRLGADWIPDHYYTDWLIDFVLPNNDKKYTPKECRDGGLVKIQYLPAPIRYFDVRVDWMMLNYPRFAECRSSYYSLEELVSLCLNLKQANSKIKDNDGNTVQDHEDSEVARTKMMEMKAHFSEWIWSDPARTVDLCRIYNAKFNRYATPKYSGNHLTFPGMSKVLTHRFYQSAAAWRIIRQDATLLAHEVGLGKTLSMISGIMELRRLGICKKPVLSVLKSTIPDIVSSFREVYPHANILVPNKKNYDGANRRRFLMQLAMGDYDCVILSHEQLYDLKLSDEFVRRYVDEEMDIVDDILAELDPNEDKVSYKQAERRKRNLEARIDKIGRDGVKMRRSPLSWEQLGIDALFLDESQVAKNLGFATTQGDIKGVNPGNDSMIAMDVNMKCRALLSSGGKVVFSTGTPIANSIGELYTLMRHLMHPRLVDMDMSHFDAWSTAFTDVTIKPEITPTGAYKVQTRLSTFVNLPELLALFRQFADVRTIASANISRPKPLEVTIASPATEDQILYMEDLVRRAIVLSTSRVDPRKDNMLLVTTHGRWASLDMHLVNECAEVDPTTKICKAAIAIFQIWEQTRRVKATQAVFCDMSTPNDTGMKNRVAEALQRCADLGIENEDQIAQVVQVAREQKQFSAYHFLRDLLLGMGIPRADMEFIHDHDSAKKKTKLFARVNSGDVAIVFGSTRKLGTGVNIQKRLIAMHHLDAPWRPMDIEQREGRGIRYGNMWRMVAIFKYVTEGANANAGFDAYLYQLLEMKARIYAQIMREEALTCRILEDKSEASLGLGEVKAIASGNPILKQKADLETQITRLEMLERVHRNSYISNSARRRSLIEKIDSLPDQIEQAKVNVKGITLIENVKAIKVQDVTDTEGVDNSFLEDHECLSAEGKKGLALMRDVALEVATQPTNEVRGNKYVFDIGQGMRIQAICLDAHTLLYSIKFPSGETQSITPYKTDDAMLKSINSAIYSYIELPETLECALKNRQWEFKNLPEVNPDFEFLAELNRLSAELKDVIKTISEDKSMSEDGASSMWRGVRGKAPLPKIPETTARILINQARAESPDWLNELLTQLPTKREEARPQAIAA